MKTSINLNNIKYQDKNTDGGCFIILLLALIWILLSCCTREYSCENCRENVDTLVVIDTVPNELITSCDIFIEDESQVKAIYPQYTSKYHPATYLIIDNIYMDGSSRYTRTYNLKNYWRPGESYVIGDTFFVKYEIRNRFIPEQFVQLDTLIY